jgi:CRP/FNR family cyclic AMP-dependent transcriptional regulator
VLIRNLVKRLREADRKIESLALIDVYGRVARVFLDMAKEVNGVLVIERAPAKQDIARLIGASREMVSRCVKHLQQAGLIATEGRRVVLLDKGGMSKRAGARETRH